MAIAREHGEGAIDVQRAMREIQKKVKAANAHAKIGEREEAYPARRTAST